MGAPFQMRMIGDLVLKAYNNGLHVNWHAVCDRCGHVLGSGRTLTQAFLRATALGHDCGRDDLLDTYVRKRQKSIDQRNAQRAWRRSDGWMD